MPVFGDAPSESTTRRWRHVFPTALLLPIAGCAGAQSSLDPAGTEADLVATLFWAMTGGGALIWLFVVGFSVFVTKIRPSAYSDAAGVHLIVWGGCVFPVVVLGFLVWFGTAAMPDLRRASDGPRIAVSGERFWWRIAYDVEGEPGVARSLPKGGVASANELYLPLGRRSEILLGSPDVIHSFWVPAIAGKTDTIPGRVNRLVLEPTRAGTFNGICAEFCGTAHAEMGFRVIVLPEADYLARVAAEAGPAALTAHPGRDLFLAHGCGACHAVRGTEAAGTVGPDLTHLAARRTLGAGILPMDEASIARFVRDPGAVKQGATMPPFRHLPEAEIATIAAWLGRLR
ncbi:cytochrome b561 [Aureimonas endophytica]|uniref:Cytochrome b561 n=1 Tax=Aureimonas endophytica TaxID=2027858 RepID=A0A916ZPI0_9HYPH|nr:c-type cytochrome [Aureimonas endophytica]GGE07850.1 cytochrome b561 [Aureimonas endophytica]